MEVHRSVVEEKLEGASHSIVYVLTNPAMPGLIKIGRTAQEDAQARLDQLYSTGVPVPFELAFACRVLNSQEVEFALHTAFAPQRINPRREFFRMEADQAIAILRLLHIEDTTKAVEAQPSQISEQEQSATRALRQRRPNLNFTEMGVPMGAVLQFTRGPDTVTVISARKVKLGDEEVSLTAATQQLLNSEVPVAPAPLWTYEGRTIRDLYEEFYGT